MSSPKPRTPDLPVDPAPKPIRRTFTAEYRAGIVAEYRAAPYGEKSGVLRREALHQSQIREWATALDNTRTVEPDTTNPEADAESGKTKSRNRSGRADRKEVDRLTRANAQLQKQLTQTEAALEIMGKLHVLLESISESTDTQTPPTTP